MNLKLLLFSKLNLQSIALRYFDLKKISPLRLEIKTFCHYRFCKDAFDKNYKATIGVDFEMERFEVLGVPFSLQL